MSVKVCLPSDGSVTPDQYMKRIDRFGVNSDTALGWCFIPENNMYRMIFRNGMRYDFGFEFECADQIYLYAAALTYDRLKKAFYPHYQNRSDHFCAIWDGYEALRQSFAACI